ncbi:enoyl-CoA hydratase [Pikeienuella sp. HZG-20]|uniref:enoyl-CoA hydratase n=1 Tax=Paludibacillus litoralis TaxID=3133267 RepID=UPI0030EE7859
MSAGDVTLAIDGGVARMTFARPEAMNAMTWAMYDQFEAHCRTLAESDEVRVVVLRGAGGRAFIAGSDIKQFGAFASAEDGLDYERKMERIVGGLSAVRAPIVGVVDGLAVGGGLSMVAQCDIRIAAKGARFGVPIARTVGNCLSMSNYAGVLAAFGEGRAKRMLILGDLIDADELYASGFLARVVEPEAMDETVERVVARLLANAPLSMMASKTAFSRLARAGERPEEEDFIRSCYGSADFKEGVRAFSEGRKPRWTGA